MTEIPLLKPTLPDVELVQNQLEDIWRSGQLTNNGSKVRELETAMAAHLGLENTIAYSSCTTGLIAVFKALGLRGEVITTPFTFMASFNAIILAGLKPVLVDVEDKSFNLDPKKVEKAISSKTCAVMPVHVYGNPCDLDAFDAISNKYNIPIIYDAAQAFGVEIDGVSILKRGAASVISTHATKVFSTVEGGGICNAGADLRKKLDEFRNFGFTSNNTVSSIGLNGKMSELHAAYGLISLKTIDRSIARRKNSYYEYLELLEPATKEGIVSCYTFPKNCRPNYNYFPIIIRKSDINLDEVVEKLAKLDIGSKRYFSPLVHQYYGLESETFRCIGSLENAIYAASSIICLPMFDGIKESEIKIVVENLLEIL
jgi:dTDP-4-amino-4,6-dideoxygalactose transaminase